MLHVNVTHVQRNKDIKQMLKPGKSLKVLTCRSPVGWPMLFVAGQMRMPVLEGCSSDGERGGAPSNMPTPGTHSPGCLCSPGQDRQR